MTDPSKLIQEELVTKGENPDPEYRRLIQAYADDPLDDLHIRPGEQPRNPEIPPESPSS